jgi:hypothetical protein
MQLIARGDGKSDVGTGNVQAGAPCNDCEESLAIGLLDSILCLAPVSAGGLKWISGF